MKRTILQTSQSVLLSVGVLLSGVCFAESAPTPSKGDQFLKSIQSKAIAGEATPQVLGLEEAPSLRLTNPTEVSNPSYITPEPAPASDLSSFPKMEDDPNASYEEDEATSTSLQGTITSLKVFRGRSQIIKFAQPITRVSIADPTIADIVPLSPDQIMLNGKQRGVTSLVVWDETGQEGIFDLHVQNDTSELMDAIHAIAPTEEMDIRITDDSLVVSGRVSNSVILDEIRRLAAAYGFRDQNFIDLTETPVPQVSLEVKIAEATRSVIKEFEVGLAANVRNRLLLTKTDALPLEGTIVDGTLPAITTDNSGGLLGSFLPNISDDFSLQSRFDVLQTDGKVTLLAEPNLVCTHGRTASFLAGGEFPFIVAVDQNGNPVIEFKQFGVQLQFTPWISIRSNRVELRVTPEVSSIDTTVSQTAANGTEIFGILTRRTDTTVELRDGESLLISGLLSRDETEALSKVPYAAELPIIGSLFRNKENTREDLELVVVVTPHIVRPGTYGNVLGNGPL